MGMPKNLVLVRHGESEGNVIQKKVKSTPGMKYPEVYNKTPDREFRLSKLGIKQTKKTGKYLKKLFPKGVDVIYVSDHTRAKETAALVCLHAGWDKVKIKIDPQLGERHWGNFHHQEDEKRSGILKMKKRDPLHTIMPDGETLLETRNRTKVMLERCARQYSGKNVLVFSHGEYIESIWSEIAHMRTEQQVKFFASHEGDIKNCQIVEFNSENGKKLSRVRTSNPNHKEYGEWKSLKRKYFTPKQLLKEVNRYPSILTKKKTKKKKK